MPGLAQRSKDPGDADTMAGLGQARDEAEGVGKGQTMTADATFGSRGAVDSVVKTGADEKCGVSSSRSSSLWWIPLYPLPGVLSEV